MMLDDEGEKIFVELKEVYERFLKVYDTPYPAAATLTLAYAIRKW
jgi:hypothetical protein